MLRKISVFICTLFFFQTILLPSGRASISTSDSPLKLTLNHYELNKEGVLLFKFLKVSIPDRSVGFFSTDLNVPGIGFSLKIERVYSALSFPKSTLGSGWTLNIIERIDDLSGNEIAVVSAYGQTKYVSTGKDTFISKDGNVIKRVKDGALLLRTRNDNTSLFSKMGTLLYKEDPNGNRLTYHYKKEKLVSISESSGRCLYFYYYPDGLLRNVKDDLNRKVSFTYNTLRQLIEVDHFNFQKSRFSYNQSSRLSKIKLPNDVELSLYYEKQNPSKIRRVVSDRNEWISFEDLKDRFGVRVSDNIGNSFVYQYASVDNQIIISIRNDTGWFTEYQLDKNGNLVGWKRPEGNHLKFEFDTLNRLIRASDSSGYVSNYKYKGKTDLPLEMKDSLGRKTGFTYDEKNNLIAIDSPGQEKIFFKRFKNGIIKQQKQGKMIVSTIAVDDFGNPVMGRRYNNAEKTFSYDKAGRVTKEILGSGEVYEYRYNDFDQLSQIYRNGEKLLKYSYGPRGYRNEIKDLKGRTFKYAFDEFGILEKAIMPGGLEFTVEKLQEKYTLKRLFPNKATKVYSYNYAGQLTEVIDPFGNKTKIAWTPSLLKDRVTNAEGNFVQYIYDEIGRLTEKRYSNGESHIFRYNNNNMVSTHSEASNQEYKYNEQGRLSSIEDKKLDITLRYKYDSLGRMKSVSIGGVGMIEYEYNDNNQISAIVDPESQATRYTYDRAGRVENVVYPNGIRKIYTYQDKLGGPVSLVFESDGKILFKERYLYDKDGLLRETRDEIEKITHSYTYNKRSELVEYERRSGANTSKKMSFSYDNNGNLVKEIQGNHKALYEYTGIGQLTKNEKGSVRHDRNGNLTAIVLKNGKYNFEYDPDNRLRKAELPDGSYKKYRYDPLGRLIGWRKAKEERHILWTGKDRLLELDGRKKLVKFYVHGQDLDEIISIKRDKKYYFHQDRLGSVRLLTDEKGRVVARHNYLPFGTPIVKNASKPELMDNSVFAGSQYDPDIGCFYMRARFYNPELKKFITKDPIEGVLSIPLTWNPYLYALNNPVNLTDPEGEFVLAVIGGAIVYGTMALVAGAAAYGAYKTGEKGLQVARTIRDEGIGPSIDRAGRAAGQKIMGAAETVTGSNISSYRESRNMNDNTPAGIANTPEGFSDTQKGLKNAEKLVDHGLGVSYGSVGAEATKMVASATNPNEREALQEVAQHQANIIDKGLRAAGTKIKGAIDGEIQKEIDSTDIGRRVKDIKDSAQAVADKAPIVGPIVKGQIEKGAQAVIDEAGKGPKKGETKPPVKPPVPIPAPPPPPVKTEVTPPVTPPVKPPVKPPEKPPVKPPVKTETQPEPQKLPDKPGPEPPVEPPPPPPDGGGSNTGNLGGDILVDLLGATSHGERRNIIEQHLNRSGTKATDDQIDRITDRIEQTMGLNQPKPPAVSSQDLINRYDQRDQQRNQAVTDRTSRDSYASGYGSRQGDRYGQDDLQRDLQRDQQWAQDAGDRRDNGHRPPAGGSSGGKGSSGSSPSTGQGLSNITVNSQTITVTFWDHGQEDGDIIDVLLNGKVLRGGILLKKAHQSFTVNLGKGKNVFGVRAVNEGKVSPNTATVKFSNVTQGKDIQVYTIKSGQRTDMNIQY